MPITPYLGGRSFDPELVAAMSGAFRNVCNAIELVGGREDVIDLVAMKIIELGHAGDRDVAKLTAKVRQIFDVE